MIRVNKLTENVVRGMRKQNSFIMIRHGESIWNQDSKFTGWTNIPLTEKGRLEAYKISQSILRNKLYPNIIFSSVLQRAIDTSNIIKNELSKDVPIYTSWRLNERHYGKLEGVPREKIRNVYGEKYTKMLRTNFYIKPPTFIDEDYVFTNEYSIYRNCYYKKIQNGESKEDVLERLLPYYENDILYTLTENCFPLIVTHKHTARVLMKHLLNMNDDDFEKYEIPSKKMLYITLDENMNYKEHDEISY
jgi:2,3-bisphosphoglycerate-dependent phosphoglycerate mutase